MLARSLDELTLSNSFARLPEPFFTRLQPQPVRNPRLLHANADVARLIGLDPAVAETPEFTEVFAGNRPLPGGEPLAAVYSGHQFGVWAGQLGDGRAILMGEVESARGSYELQLKGSGLTPYSRMGDGRAVLRSSVREYLASAAMHGLGIPTTHALCIIAADDLVRRETVETAAVVTRAAETFVRFGSFEHWAANKQVQHLQTLADYVIDRFYPECRQTASGDSSTIGPNPTDAAPIAARAEQAGSAPGAAAGHDDSAMSATRAANAAAADAVENPSANAAVIVRFLRAVMQRTAKLMAQWQAVGFMHGVMNTDNMSIVGLTLDYGPYGFMDGFDANHICNHTDTGGRYAWNTQPMVGHWNLYRLADALYPLVGNTEPLRAVLDEYESEFLRHFQGIMAAKLGLRDFQAGDDELLDELWRLMHTQRADFTLTFRRLAWVDPAANADHNASEDTAATHVDPAETLSGSPVGTDGLSVSRPAPAERFEDLFHNQEPVQAWLARYRARLARDNRPTPERQAQMLSVNPLYVLRNHLAENAIRAAKAGDPTEIDRLITILHDPYTERPGYESYAALPPEWASSLEVSCSS